ncbi:conserved hypothetical protein [Magpiepox virus 2]|nr:conserved hypothetical protein [Magpiepox virus 2]
MMVFLLYPSTVNGFTRRLSECFRVISWVILV